MKEWKKRTVDTCPLCDEHEDSSHILLCQSDLATARWNLGLDEIEATLASIGTPKGTTTAILSHLTHWRRDDGITPETETVTSTLQNALFMQQFIR